MADETFDIGDEVVLTHVVTLGPTAVDPGSVTFDVKAPDGTVTHGEYAGGSGTVARTDTGTYEYRVVIGPGQSGSWAWRWATTNPREAEEGRFRVRRSRVL